MIILSNEAEAKIKAIVTRFDLKEGIKKLAHKK